MIDITQIPRTELINDLHESLIEIKVCQTALRLGITTCSSGDVTERLRENYEIAERIRCEIVRREASNGKELS